MAHSNGMHADKRFVVGIKQRSLRRNAIYRVWPIKDKDCDTCFFAGTHAEIQRPDKCVIARTHVLKIDKQNIETLQHFRRRLAMFAVKTVNRNAEPRVLVAFPFHHVILGLATKTMLRTEKRGEAEEIAVMLLQNMRRMLELCRNRCRMK